MTPDERIEAAARALYAQDGPPAENWDEEGEVYKVAYRHAAKVALEAAFPGIMAGTHVELHLDPLTCLGRCVITAYLASKDKAT